LIILGRYWGEGEAEVSIESKVSVEDKVWSTVLEFPQMATLHPESKVNGVLQRSRICPGGFLEAIRDKSPCISKTPLR
jgi:hypothetical protein